MVLLLCPFLLIILKLRVFDGSYKRWQSSYIHAILNGLREYSYTMGKHWAEFISCYISIIASFTGPSLPLREGGVGREHCAQPPRVSLIARLEYWNGTVEWKMVYTLHEHIDAFMREV